MVALPPGPPRADLRTFRKKTVNPELLRVQLDDELLVHRRRLDVFASRHGYNTRLEVCAVDVQPRRNSLALCEIARLEHHRVFVHLVLERHFIPHLYQIAGDIHLLALDPDVAVQHELASLRPRPGEARAIYHVVQAPFEHDHQVRPCRALGALRLFKIVAELPLEQPVSALDLLLFAQLDAIADHLRPTSLAVLSGNKVALLDRAFFRKTPEAFQEELLPFPTAQPANRFTMSCQVLISFFRNRDSRGRRPQPKSSRPARDPPYKFALQLAVETRRGGVWEDGNHCVAPV